MSQLLSEFWDNVINKTVNQEFVSLLSKTSFESTVFYDLKEYFISNLPDVGPIVKSIIEKIEKSINTDDSPFEKSRKTSAIEFLFYLSVMAVDRPNISISTDMYKYIYGKGVVGTIHNGYVKGDLPPIDFSSLTISNGKFTDYPNLLNSEFKGSSFIYTTFKRCFNESCKSKSILDAKIDFNSCELGDLQQAFDNLNEKNRVDSDKLTQECRKFLGSFTRGQSYRDNNEVHINFSTVVKGLHRSEFKKIIRKGYVVLNADKEVDRFYTLAPHFRGCARRFVLNGTKSNQIKEFIKFVKDI